MDLRVSYNWLKEFVSLGIAPEEFAKHFSLKSQTVERWEQLEPEFSGVITVKIVRLAPHPNADRLRLATVTTGSTEQTVVCGAPNVASGQIVTLAQAGAMVLGENGVPQRITKTTIRGVESNGMLCSPRELGLGQDHEGIFILPEGTPAGKKLESLLPLPDTIFDIEVTSNRPDAMSVIGLAREAAAVFGGRLKLPKPHPQFPKKQSLPLAVMVQDKKNCRRYQAVVVKNVTVKPSPLWLKLRLLSAGKRPVNNIVDITNYVLLEYGQPLHAFDYDTIGGQSIIVRQARAGERLAALDGVTYKLKSDQLVIADAQKPLAIAGVMGGQHSATTGSTTTVVFEAATFHPLSVRLTARSLGLRSDSSNLFEKGLHPEALPPALARAVALTQELAGGELAGPVFDTYHSSFQPTTVRFDPAIVKRYLSIDIPIPRIKKMLSSLGLKVSGSRKLKITVPWWREGDIAIAEDIIEELARLHGYDQLPTHLPAGKLTAEGPDLLLFWEYETKCLLAGMGFTEVYNYSMVSETLLERAGFSTKKTLALANPFNEEMTHLRTTLLPQLLQNVSDNLPRFPEQQLFELAHLYLDQGHDLPREVPQLAGVVVGPNAFAKAKGALELLLKKFGVRQALLVPPDLHNLLWEKGQAIDVRAGKEFLGQLGVVKKDRCQAFGITAPVVFFDLDFAKLSSVASTTKTYRPIPEFPTVERDISIVVDRPVRWHDINQSLKGLDPLIVSIRYLSTFVGASLGEGKKAVAFRLTFRAKDQTLKSEAVDAIMKRVVDHLQDIFHAVVR